MKAIIIDDEKNSSDLTLRLMNDFCREVQVLGVASSVEEGHHMISQLKPDLVLLDVEMGDGTGFDLLNRFTSVPFKIIFITAHQAFALDAFRRSAVDYLLKPLSPPDLVNAVLKAARSYLVEDWNAQLKTLMETIAEPAKQRDKIVLKTMERIYSLHISDIVRFQSEGSYTEVYLKDGRKIVVSRLIKEFDDLLSASGFLRVHQSHLINIDFIYFYEKSDTILTMQDNSVVPVSKRKKENLLQLLNSI